jgi:hypothetical protein
MPGLDPGVHVDRRVKPGDDEEGSRAQFSLDNVRKMRYKRSLQNRIARGLRR